MNESWTTLANAPAVLRHAGDAHPAWLWSQDGQRLIWANAAADLFLAKIKKHGLKRVAPAVPIKGQVARIVRLGSPGRTTLARIQFLAGDKPASATCRTTPLSWDKDETALLIVGVDPIEKSLLQAAGPRTDDTWQQEIEPPPVEETPEPVIPTPSREAYSSPSAPLAPDNSYADELRSWRDGDAETAYEPATGTDFISTPDSDASDEWAESLDGDVPAEADASPEAELTEDDESEEPGEMPESVPGPDTVAKAGAMTRIGRLVDLLAADEALYTPLTEKDDVAPAPAHGTEPSEPTPLDAIRSMDIPLDAVPEDEAIAPPEGEAQPDAETVERVSRYNFDELGRILSDRIGERQQARPPAPPQPPAAPAETQSGSLVNLSGETLVLNRLPLGIMVFRDQQVLFANRAITEMVGYGSVESLRAAGLASIFPSTGDEAQEAGPINHLVQRDGTLVPVTARLQSISWQGRPALMLSASATEVRTGHEDAIRAFAQSFAELRGDGFIETSRAGLVSSANAAALSLLGASGKQLTGRTLSSLVAADEVVALRGFLERPARFAETARPSLTLRSADGRADLHLFALGQAGILSGYFALVQAREATPARLGGPGDVDPALLARISRGVRRPLNTIVGFSDLLRTKAFGELGNERYEGYADDIARAGREIAGLVDELDDYSRLREGRYLAQRASLDLTALLEGCVLRIRSQANTRRVFVRNAISETLPRITADRASLAQAVLNLLASAIDQTPTGGTVVISAQRPDDGAIAIHVRDSSAHAVDMAERFVVFRDGTDRSGQVLTPVRSSVGLALTRALLTVNAVSLSVDPAGAAGLLFTLKIPADLVDTSPLPLANTDGEARP